MSDKIPENEMQNVIDVFWQLLGEVEGKTNPEKDVLNKMLVESAHRVLNRCGVTKTKPRWLQEARL